MVDGMHMHEVVCVLCAVNLDDKASRVNVRGRTSFPIEVELRKLPLKLVIDDSTRVCFPCFRKLKKKKSLEENFATIAEELVRKFKNDSESMVFVPSFASTPTKVVQPFREPTTCTSSTPRTFWPPQPTPPQRDKLTEPGVTVGCSFVSYLVVISLILTYFSA